MHRDSNGMWVQDHAGESVPAAHANAMELQRQLQAGNSLVPQSEWRRLIEERDISSALSAKPVIFPRRF